MSHNPYILEAFLIGMAGAAIFGPISMLFVQKTLKLGVKGAVSVALGAILGDMIYSFIATAGLRAVAHFLMGKIIFIKIFGGSFLLYLAAKEYWQRTPISKTKDSKFDKNLFGKTFLLAMTGPLNILFFMSAFASIGGKEISISDSLLIVLGIFLGSITWLTFLGSIVLILRGHIPTSWLQRIRFLSAMVLASFGLWALFTSMTG